MNKLFSHLDFKKKEHVMLDIETLGSAHNSVILQIAMVKFNLNGDIGGKIELFPSIEEQISSRRKIDNSTVDWWEKNNQDLLMELMLKAKEPRKDILKSVRTGLVVDGMDYPYVWARSPIFDVAILSDYLNAPNIFNYRRQMDVRAIEFLTGDKPKASHNAIEDCLFQIEFIASSLQRMKDNKIELNKEKNGKN